MLSGERKIGAPGAIRTPGPQIRSLMLYPAELRVHWKAAIRVTFSNWQPQFLTFQPEIFHAEVAEYEEN